MAFGPSESNHPDATAYRAATEAYRRRDFAALKEAIHEDVEWHFAGDTWIAGEIRGRENLLAHFSAIDRRTGGTFVLRDLSIRGTDHHVFAHQQLGATHAGEYRAFDAASVIRFAEGRQIERWIYVADIDSMRRFFDLF